MFVDRNRLSHAKPHMVPKLLVTAVEYYRAPARFAHLTDPSQPLPIDFDAWLAESCAAVSPRNIAATAAALGIQASLLHEAFLFFLRHTLLVPGADHYRVLGLTGDCSAETIKQHHWLLVNLFHPDRAIGEDPRRVEITARLNAAYRTLRDPEARARYHAQLRPPGFPATQARGRVDVGLPGHPASPVARPRSPARQRRPQTLPFTLGALGAAVASALVLPVFMKSEDPVLSISPERADVGVPRPAYLRQADPALTSARYKADQGSRNAQPDPFPADSGASRSMATVAEMPAAPLAAEHRLPIPTETRLALTDPRLAERLNEVKRIRETLSDRQLGTYPEPTDTALSRTETSDHTDSTVIGRAADPDGAPRMLDVPQALLHETKPASGRTAPASNPPEDVTKRPTRPAEKDVPVAQPLPLTTARQRNPPAEPTKPDSPDMSAAARVIRKLKRLYAKGDVDGLTRLFTVNAVLNQGTGRTFIRQWYAAAFARDQQRSLSISNLRWREGAHERLLGNGQLLLTGRKSAASKWHQQRGTVEIELVPWQDQYYIGKLIHHLSRR